MTFTKFYSHVIETPPSKSETQHGVQEMLKGFQVCGKLCKVKQVGDPTCNSQKLFTRY